MTARLDANIRLGLYSFAFGSAHGIADGSLHFNSGLAGIAEEFAEDGTLRFSLELGSFVYRSFRMRDLYTPPPRP